MNYAYEAINSLGATVPGELEAASEAELVRRAANAAARGYRYPASQGSVYWSCQKSHEERPDGFIS